MQGDMILAINRTKLVGADYELVSTTAKFCFLLLTLFITINKNIFKPTQIHMLFKITNTCRFRQNLAPI